MFTTLFSVFLFVASIRFALAQSEFMIYTPVLVQCQPANIIWTDTGNLPYDLLVVPAEDVCGESIEDLGNQTSTSMTWTVNITAGINVVLSLMDAAGDEAWSGPITVGASDDTSCLQNNATSSSTSTAPTVTPSGSTGTVASASGSSSSSLSSSSSSSSSSSLSLSLSTSAVPVRTAGPGPVHNSGALSRRIGAATLLGSAILTAVTFSI